MSIKVQNIARSFKTGSPINKAVLMALADYADDMGEKCYPSIERLVNDTEICERSVRNALRNLEERGFIFAVKKSKGRITNEFKINLNPAPDAGLNEIPTRHQMPPNPASNAVNPASDALNPASNAPNPLYPPLPINEPLKTRARKPRAEFVLPDWIDKPVWDGYEQHRRKLGKPLNDYKRQLSISKLEQLKADGHDPTGVIRQTINEGWIGLFAIKGAKNESNTGWKKRSQSERAATAIERALTELDEHYGQQAGDVYEQPKGPC